MTDITITDSATRRAFLETSGTALSGLWLALNLPAIEIAAAHARRALARGAPFDVLSAEESAELSAMAARIVPTDDTPGATEAGVIYFMDKALGTFAKQMLDPIRKGLPDLQKAARQQNASTASFAALTAAQQDAVLKSIEKTPLFGAVRYLTVAGMFADPSYGGNKDQVGWRLLGFGGAHAYQPPFGYYDRVYREQGG
jgi:gluconate 2-dehydrogenase gamma chain